MFVCVCICVTNSGQLMSDIMHTLDEASNNNLIIIPKREKEGVSQRQLVHTLLKHTLQK